jgi:hypothetical protein
MGVGGQRHSPAAYFPAKRPGTHFTGGGWAPQQLWMGMEILTPSGNPDVR